MSVVEVPRSAFDATFQHFRSCGQGLLECVVYWVARLDRPDTVVRVVHPRHRSGSFGYEVDSAYVNELFLELRQSQEKVRAQVHTHPREASHSETDDRFSLVPALGFLSLVIPDFAEGPVSLNRSHLVVMSNDGGWRPIDPEARLVLV